MKKELIITRDGSHSLAIPERGVTYHSVHGALAESMHVFLEAGFRQLNKEVKILEMGFGTGLNALLTCIEANRLEQQVYYEAIEKFPLEEEFYTQLNYCDILQIPDYAQRFELMHRCAWNEEAQITSYFTLRKIKADLLEYQPDRSFNLVYFDAFAPADQPELWTASVFEKIYNRMDGGGILVTYSSKGSVRRALQAAGFGIEKIPGPAGKREMLRAIKKGK